MNNFLTEDRVKKINEISKDKKLSRYLSEYIDNLYNEVENKKKHLNINFSSYISELYSTESLNFPRVFNRMNDTLRLCYLNRTLIYDLKKLTQAVAEYENLKDRNVVRRDIIYFFNRYKPKIHVSKINYYFSKKNSKTIGFYLDNMIKYIDYKMSDKDVSNYFNSYTEDVNNMFDSFFYIKSNAGISEVFTKEAIELVFNSKKEILVGDVLNYIAVKYNLDLDVEHIYNYLSNDKTIEFKDQNLKESISELQFSVKYSEIFKLILDEIKKNKKYLIES